ncbi:MAG: hypothetical protein GWN39_02925, partial [Thermoplasmata archaeon]|nr:hypothetical protein [Thermoplasmata archaeon]
MGADIELDGGPGQMENQHRMRVHEGLVDMVRSIRDMGLRDKQVEELLIANAEMEFGQGAQRRAAADRFYDL